ncbi:beta-lactam-binding protein with PASTA domain [Sinomonas atrocyanea]|uniref:PASTA domain-containing protein n=1 Tax=Sinomonas atrocyanea TaxID=37927 RepID=UPI0027821AEB|nr:PASTA domain-containing protein [Sinomonas atrocyanea]MDP9883106.1 beta-lactam-binding protein with PASTA domain [Sinomonas atrocyanea]
MKKSLSVLALLAIMVTGCSATNQSAKPSAEPAAATSAPSNAPLPNEVGKTLDKAKKELEGLGYRVKATDTVEGKAIIVKSNWEVISQDPAAGASAPEASTVNLGVKHLSATPSPTPTPTPTPTPDVVVGVGTGADVGAGNGSVANTGGGSAEGTGTSGGSNQTNTDPYVAPTVPKAGTIICKDGYVWPGTTRQGACHGHKGIAN